MTFSLIWLLPLLVMVPCYLTIIVLVHQRSQQFDKCASGNIGEAKMKTVKMTGILILGFLLCVTPYGLIEILSVWYVANHSTGIIKKLTKSRNFYQRRERRFVFDFQMRKLFRTFICVNNCFNPLLYRMTACSCLRPSQWFQWSSECNKKREDRVQTSL